MTNVIPFPAGRTRAAATEFAPYDFWVQLLDPMTPAQRRRVVELAHRCGVLDDRDAEILPSLWCDREGA